jgi:hypothetical protein
MAFIKSFEKTAAIKLAQTINERIGNPFGKVTPKTPPPPPAAPANVGQGKTIGQMIGFPG